MKENALTLIEVLVVVIIIGVLSTVTYLQLGGFQAFTEHGYSREAQANLKLIAAAEKIYRREIGMYYPYPGYGGPVLTTTDINTTLKIALPPTTGNWDYTMTTTAGGFTIVANRKGVGGYLDCKYTLTDTATEPTASSNCP